MMLKDGEQVEVSVPFLYTIGEKGPTTGKILTTIEDCYNEVRAEVDNGELLGQDILLTHTTQH